MGVIVFETSVIVLKTVLKTDVLLQPIDNIYDELLCHQGVFYLQQKRETHHCRRRQLRNLTKNRAILVRLPRGNNWLNLWYRRFKFFELREFLELM